MRCTPGKKKWLEVARAICQIQVRHPVPDLAIHFESKRKPTHEQVFFIMSGSQISALGMRIEEWSTSNAAWEVDNLSANSQGEVPEDRVG